MKMQELLLLVLSEVYKTSKSIIRLLEGVFAQLTNF
jgi:hypothetical protein